MKIQHIIYDMIIFTIFNKISQKYKHKYAEIFPSLIKSSSKCTNS